MSLAIPDKIVLQWHITNRCNLRCSHCYQHDYGANDSSLETLTGILAQYKALIKNASRKKGSRVRGHITVTGGEPFLHENFLELLELFAAEKNWMTYGTLTNGTLVDAERARRIKKLDAYFVQVSLDGIETTHDSIRGKGSHSRTVSALKDLTKAKVRTLVSFTANETNYHEFPKVAALARSLNVWRVWSDRQIPDSGDCANREWTRDYFSIMNKAASSWRSRISRTDLCTARALQFLEAGGRPYRCQAGSGLITIMPDGTLYPCRRMPIVAGNVLETGLSELYFTSTLFESLRDEGNIIRGCEKCFYAKLCRGGLRCLSYAMTGSPFNADPDCPRADRKTVVSNLDEVTA